MAVGLRTVEDGVGRIVLPAPLPSDSLPPTSARVWICTLSPRKDVSLLQSSERWDLADESHLHT